MKVAICEKYGENLQIKEITTPSVGINDCLVKIHASGVCHTDLHAVTGDWPVKSIMPLVPGHEGVGEILEVGSNVTNVKVGDRVGIPWLYNACGFCEWCITGRETICPNANYTGYTKHGGYATHCLADARYVCKVPDQISYEEAAPLFCAGVTTYKALKQSKVRPGQWVAIYGIGGLGHLAVQYAVAMGMKVVAVDIDDKKLQLAKKYGAQLLINSAKTEPKDVLFKDIGGVHGAVVTAVAKKPFLQAFNSIRNGGTMVCVGLPPENMEVPIFDTVLKEIEITGSLVGTRKDLEEALEFAVDGKVKAEFDVVKLEKINEVFNQMRAGAINGRIVMKIK